MLTREPPPDVNPADARMADPRSPTLALRATKHGKTRKKYGNNSGQSYRARAELGFAKKMRFDARSKGLRSPVKPLCQSHARAAWIHRPVPEARCAD